jgi:radical SAM protein with 4Fe4S-binding SPASM domain
MPADPSFEELRTAIDFLVSLGTIRLVISGGEPFMRNDLPELASYAKACGVQQIIILTNGLFISSANVRPLATLVDGIAVAFDGYSEGSGAFLRGEQRFSSLVQAIRIIQQENIEARILPTIHGKNIDDIAHYEKLARELGATVRYSLLLASPHDAGAFLLSDTQLAHLGELSSHGAFSYGSNAYESRMVALSARRSCGAGTRTLSVAADGKVYPCHMLHDKHFYMGKRIRDAPENFYEQHGCHGTTSTCLMCEISKDVTPAREAYLCGGGLSCTSILARKEYHGS